MTPEEAELMAKGFENLAKAAQEYADNIRDIRIKEVKK